MNLSVRIQSFLDDFLPLLAHRDAETLRHCRLIIGFGFLGGVFGLIYAAFYFSIGHPYGGGIITVCDTGFLLVPWLLSRAKSNFSFHGHILCTILTIGFCLLGAIEGGVKGHAITWLVTVPFCAVLLIGVRASYIWCGICTAVIIVFSSFGFLGIDLPYLYPASWHNTITVAGYVGLALFLFLLAQIFERGRADAHEKMIQAYHELAQTTNQLAQANEELARANQQLVQLNKEKNEFIGIAAHDLKNPLSAVLGYAEILSMQPSPNREGNQLFGEKIRTAAGRMLQLVMDLLDINAIEEGRMGLNIEEVDLGGVLRETIATQQLAAQAKKIPIHLVSPPHVLARADAHAMMQVVENLLSNAVKFSPPGSPVTVKVLAHEDNVTIEIQDNGPGLSEEDQGKLFQKFSRLTPQPTGGESSNGLGLSIVKRLAESMGARVGCRSQLGRGTVFWVNLRGHRVVAAA